MSTMLANGSVAREGAVGGRLFEAGCFLTFPTYRVGAYWRWALNRTNTVNSLCFPLTYMSEMRNSLPTLFSSASDGNPNPNTVLALASDHWPNFCDVLVKVMFGKTVLLIIACQNNNSTNLCELFLTHLL